MSTQTRTDTNAARGTGTISTRREAEAGHYIVTETRGEETRTAHVGFEEVRVAAQDAAADATETSIAEQLARPLLEQAWKAEPAKGAQGGHAAPPTAEAKTARRTH
jgi:hypothetical protein